jgi:hypothetical protein
MARCCCWESVARLISQRWRDFWFTYKAVRGERGATTSAEVHIGRGRCDATKRVDKLGDASIGLQPSPFRILNIKALQYETLAYQDGM